MSIIRVRDNKNNRGKRKGKIKDRKKKGVAEAIVIVCELNDFVMRLS